ncbi:hypothetical protein ACFX19_005536 [Malus domestica]
MLRHGLVASAFVNMFARKAQGEHALISGSMEQGKWVHAHMIKSAVTLVAFVVNTLIDMYAKSGSIEDAKKVSEKFHTVTIVDLLGRAGLLGQAEKFIRGMLIEPAAAVWGALLGACRLHKNT